jgi:hypothetical protein
MNLTNILAQLARTESTDFDRQDSRRNMLRTVVRGASVAALPVVLSSLFNKASAQTTSNPIADALNGYLLLEYLQEDFYNNALGNSVASGSPLIPSGLEQSAVIEIRNHQTAHIKLLTQYINSAGGTPIDRPKFDFSGGKGTPGGKYSDVFTDYNVFLALAQCFEDITVRAYKAGFTALQTDNNLITAAFRLHSVEARHAAHIRHMRSQAHSALLTGDLRPWITGSDSNIADPDLDIVYAGEDNTQQSNIQIKDINGTLVDEVAATEAFDEPQDVSVIAGFLNAFIITGP